MASTIRASFRNIADVQAALESVELGLGRLIGDVAKEQLTPIIHEVQTLLPFDPTHRGWKGEHKRPDPGHIRDSVVGGVTGNALTIRSTHPGGPVHWWGGTIAPRGAEITIERRLGAGPDFTSRKAEQVGRDVENALDRLCREHGL